MNARKERKLLEGIGNNLILSADLVFQQLEGMQLLEDELRDARSASEKLKQEKDQVSIALEAEKAKVTSLAQEKSSALKEKKLAIQEKELAIEATRKSKEEKVKSDEEWRLVVERAKKADGQTSVLRAKVLQLEAELQALTLPLD